MATADLPHRERVQGGWPPLRGFRPDAVIWVARYTQGRHEEEGPVFALRRVFTHYGPPFYHLLTPYGLL
jgi:hypothetical protein